uniref:Mucin-5AC-like n=1 Tax=Crassostrea virginica TaxID=6565 RepID=A0A8B8AS43_CRAVI|nr:mucin-5AC-like [Crassostrea virginica]
MRVSEKSRDLSILTVILNVLCLINVCVASKCLHHEGPVMEMCTDSVIEAQHAIMLDTSLFTSSNGNCVCRFNITGSFLDIGHLDYPEQCGSKLDFRLGPEGSPSSEVQSIDCTKITAEFNATEVRDGSVVITHTEPGVADPGFCVSMETDPNETIFVQCTALPEETTGSHNRESSTTKNELTPISIKDMFQDQSTGASNAIQELLSKSGISADSIFLEPNLIQTPMNSLDLMDKMVTPASFGEDKTERTQPNVPSSSTFANNTTQTPSTFTNSITTEENTETTVASTTLFETTTQQISESSSTNATDSSTTAETSSTTSTSSSTLSSTTSTSSTTSVQESSTSSTSVQESSTTSTSSTTSVQESSTISTASSTLSSTTSTSSTTSVQESSTSSTTNVQEKDTQSPVDGSSAATTSAPTKEENIPASSRLSTSLPTTKSTTSSAPYSTTLATEETTTHSGEYTTMSEERTTDSVSTTSQLSTTTSTPEQSTSDSTMLNFDITQHTTSTTKPPVEFSSTEKSADITTTVLSTTILGMVSSSEGKSSSSTPHSDLTTSVLSSTPTSLPETTSQKDHLRLETSRGTTESTTSDIKPTRTLIDETPTPTTNSSVRDGIVSSMEISTPMYNTVLPDLNELYSEELLRLASSTVVPYSQSPRGSTETPKSDITVTGSPNLSTEKHAKEQEKTTETPNTTTDSPVAIKEETKTTQQFTSTTAKTSASTTTRVAPTAQTDEPSTEEPSTARTTSKDITTVKPTTTTVKTTSTTFKPTTKEVVPTESKPTTQDPASNESSTPKLIMAPSNNPRGDTAHLHTEHPTEKPAIVEKPVMTRLPPIVIPVDSTKQITFKPSFTPGHNHGAKHEESKPKPPADLSTVNDSEQLDDDTITVIVVGSVIGILVFIAIIVILATFLKSRRNASKQTEEKDDIEMNGGTKGIDNPLLQLEEEESMANGTSAQSNGKANGVVEGKAEASTAESGKDAGIAASATSEDSPADGKTTESNSDDLH